MSTPKTTIPKEEQQRRAEAAREIRHSTELEGGRTSDEARGGALVQGVCARSVVVSVWWS